MNRSSALFLTCTLGPLALAVSAHAANWTNQGYSPGINGFNPHETTISANNVANLALTWQSSTTDINGVDSLVEDKGTIFVLSVDANNNSDIVALNGSTGAELWKAPTGYSGSTFTYSGLAAGANLVFAFCTAGPPTFDGLCAYSQKTGKTLWSDNFYVQGVAGDFSANIQRPTVANGVVYLSENMCDAGSANCDDFWALDAKTGAILWGTQPPHSNYRGPSPSSTNYSPAISTAGGTMYVPCSYDFRDDQNADHVFTGVCTFATSTGVGGWQAGELNTTNGQEGAGGVSVSGSTVFFQQSYVDLNEDVLTAFDAATGNQLWTFGQAFVYQYTVQPTVARNVVYWPDGKGTLWALKEKTGATIWSFGNWPNGCSPANGPNGSGSQPQIVNGVVFISMTCTQLGGNTAGVFALRASDGTVLWQDQEGTSANGAEHGGSPMIVNGTLYSDCYQVCAYTLPAGAARH